VKTMACRKASSDQKNTLSMATAVARAKTYSFRSGSSLLVFEKDLIIERASAKWRKF
jgi:hypothetical protein